MFENDNYQIPLIDKGNSLSQARVLFINECESFLSKFEIDNSKPKKEALNQLNECEQNCSILLNKINDIGLQILTNKQNNSNTEIIPEIVFSINSSFEKVKEHFKNENKKYFMSLQKEKDLNKKLYNKEESEQDNPEIQNITAAIGACLSEVQKNLAKINSACADSDSARNKICQKPEDSFINVNDENDNKNINPKKFEIIPLIIGFILFILILLFSIYLYICYLK